MSEPLEHSAAWIADCMTYRGVILTGTWAHWCDDWDGLPVDETTPEWDCCHCTWDGEQPPAIEDRPDNMPVLAREPKE